MNSIAIICAGVICVNSIAELDTVILSANLHPERKIIKVKITKGINIGNRTLTISPNIQLVLDHPPVKIIKPTFTGGIRPEWWGKR